MEEEPKAVVCERKLHMWETDGWHSRRYEDIYHRCSEFTEIGAISEEKYLKVVDAIIDALRKLTPSAELVYSFPMTSVTRNENMETPVIKDPHPVILLID